MPGVVSKAAVNGGPVCVYKDEGEKCDENLFCYRRGVPPVRQNTGGLRHRASVCGHAVHPHGGMPIQLGLCWGYNTRLNCLEYHRDSEVNVGARDFILLLGKQDEIENGVLDTGKVKAFRVPAGMAVEVYATTLHYAPCHTNAAEGFCTAVVLPRGTNTEKPSIVQRGGEDALLWARNKWLLAHAASDEAAQGAYVGLAGENIDISDSL